MASSPPYDTMNPGAFRMSILRRTMAPVFLVTGLVPAYAAAAPVLTVTPPAGSGRPGEVLRVTGSGFAPNATVAIRIGGVAVTPDAVPTDESGNLQPAFVALAGALPGGKHDATAEASPPVVFKAVYLVRPILPLDPPVGDGRAGATWRTNRSIATGGWFGMVFALPAPGSPRTPSSPRTRSGWARPKPGTTRSGSGPTA